MNGSIAPTELKAESCLLWLRLRKRTNNICEQRLRVGDRGLNLLLGNVNDIAIVEAVAQPVDIIETAPSVVFPFDRVRKALEYHGSVSIGSRKPISRSLERNSRQPECGVVSGGKPRSKRVAFSARIGDGADCAAGETFENRPIRLCGV
jgi:hypothetical protein